MAKTLAFVVTALIAATALLVAYNPIEEIDNQQVLLETHSVEIPYIFNTECTESLAVECVADIEMTVRACSAAFETQGADIIADIKCAKDLMADKKHCWPCICA